MNTTNSMTNLPKTSRRKFVMGSAAATGTMALGAVGIWRFSPWFRPMSVNGDVRLGVIGLRNKGADHMKHLHQIRGVRLTALCDPDQEILDREKEKFRKERGATIKTYRDMRLLFDSDEVDAVVIATPNHWHALAAIWAMQAGKDVYLEKPVSHTMEEGVRLVAAAEKYGRIVQAGTQHRSNPGTAEALEWLKEGNLGSLQKVHSVSYKRRKPVERRKSALPIPPSLDYDLWCGPAEMLELFRSRVHYDWHWMWNTGDGDLGNMGIHDLDIARWFLGNPRLPERVISLGGRFAFGDDCGETPNTQLTCFSWGKDRPPVIHELRGLGMEPNMEAMDAYKGLRVGNVFYFEGGYLAKNVAYDENGRKVKKFSDNGGGGHLHNWLESVVARDKNKLIAPIEQGHESSALCHLGNISLRAGQPTPLPEASEQLGNFFPEAHEMWDRTVMHLQKHAIDFEQSPIQFGRLLEGNESSDSYPKDVAHFFSRNYRRGFELPVIK